MAKMKPDKIVMISCNHATGARDCAILEELGYKTVKVKGVDMFPRTAHVECVVLMSRKDKQEPENGVFTRFFGSWDEKSDN